MAVVTCPQCNKLAERSGYQTWQIVVAICLFPIGLLALLSGRKPTRCNSCNHTWVA